LLPSVAVLAALTGAAQSAHADGFVCATYDRELLVKVYNHTQPSQGTRNAAVMIVSDPSAPAGKQTIAVFRDTDSTLQSFGATYLATVSPRTLPNLNLADTFISAFSLDSIQELDLSVNFSYGLPVVKDGIVDGMLVIQKLNGETVRKEVTCTRYLKGN